MLRTTTCLAGALALCAGLTASAQTMIYAMNNLPQGATTDQLVRFNSNDPATRTIVGASGVTGGFVGMDFDSQGRLFGWTGFNTTSPGLHRINPGTGVATRVNPAVGTADVQDMAWDPANNRMVAIIGTTATAVRLASIDLNTGATTPLGNITGLPAGPLVVGLAFDRTGNFYIHNIVNDTMYRGLAGGFAVTSFFPLGIDTNFSQGMTIDWSRSNTGLHAAIGNVPAFFSRLYRFDPAAPAGAYSLVGNFSPDGSFPTFEGGDIGAIPEFRANVTADNGGDNGWAIFFDVTAATNNVTVTHISSASTAPAGAPFSVEVFVRSGSGLGISGPGAGAAGWTSLGVTPAAQGPASGGVSLSINIPDFVVAAGATTGVAVRFTGAGPRYFGIGAAPIQTFSDANISLRTGDARSNPFTAGGSFFSSRGLAGSLTYFVGGTAVPTCRADLNNDGELTFDDIQLFVSLYNANNPAADFNNDGEWTFDDIQAFIALYNAGC